MRKTNKKQTRVIYLETGMTLADVIERLKADGVTDLTKVSYDHSYVGCCADHGDGYCYCPSSYNDMRFEYEVEVK